MCVYIHTGIMHSTEASKKSYYIPNLYKNKVKATTEEKEPVTLAPAFLTSLYLNQV